MLTTTTTTTKDQKKNQYNKQTWVLRKRNIKETIDAFFVCMCVV